MISTFSYFSIMYFIQGMACLYYFVKIEDNHAVSIGDMVVGFLICIFIWPVIVIASFAELKDKKRIERPGLVHKGIIAIGRLFIKPLNLLGKVWNYEVTKTKPTPPVERADAVTSTPTLTYNVSIQRRNGRVTSVSDHWVIVEAYGYIRAENDLRDDKPIVENLEDLLIRNEK